MPRPFGHRDPSPPIPVQNASSKENTRVFLDISFNGGPAERLIIELFDNIVPKTAENFRALCTGEKGFGENTKAPLHYKGTVFSDIDKGFFARGGNISKEQDGTCGESIYGGYFESENFKLSHSEAGVLTMAAESRDKIGSVFYLLFKPRTFLDGCNVVFGKVIKGMSTVSRINEFGKPGGKHLGVVKIVNCGQIYEDEGKKKNTLKTDSSDDEQVKECGDRAKKRKFHLLEQTENIDCKNVNAEVKMVQTTRSNLKSPEGGGVVESDQAPSVGFEATLGRIEAEIAMLAPIEARIATLETHMQSLMSGVNTLLQAARLPPSQPGMSDPAPPTVD